MPHNQLMMLISKASRVYKNYCLPVCRQYQINQTGLSVLLFLANNPEYNSAKDVCKIRGIESGIVSVTVESLIQAGLLLRTADSADRRVQRLTLTAQSADIISQGQAIQKTFWKDISQGLTTEDIACFTGIMNSIMANIDQIEMGVKRND